MGELRSSFPKEKNGKCTPCSENYFKWIKQKILEDDRYGLMLGGYPALLKIPAKIFELLSTEPIELSEIYKETGSFFDFFLCIYLANQFGSKQYFANARIERPFVSNEIDIGVVIERDIKRNLLILETTSYYHKVDSLKNKFLNYSSLRKGEHNKFLYIYLTLGQKIAARLGKNRIDPIDSEHPDLGIFSSILSNNDDFELISLPDNYKELDANIKRDWWDRQYLERSYKYIIAKIDEVTKRLAI